MSNTKPLPLKKKTSDSYLKAADTPTFNRTKKIIEPKMLFEAIFVLHFVLNECCETPVFLVVFQTEMFRERIAIIGQVWYQKKATNFENWREAVSNLQLTCGLAISLLFRDYSGSILLGSNPPEY